MTGRIEIGAAFQKRYETMTKEEVITQYNEDYRQFIETLAQIPESRKCVQFLNDWSIKEIVDHIGAWNLETIKGVKLVLRGEIPWFFDDEERINRFNQEEINKRKGVPLPKVLEEVETNHGKLIKFLEKLPDKLFHQDFGKTWKGQKVTPSLVSSYRHYLHHTNGIKEWLKGAKTQ